MKHFKTSEGKFATNEELENILLKVSKDFRQIAINIYKEDPYASHVTLKQKRKNLVEDLRRANDIEGGNIDNFTVWQRINAELTGECVPFLPKRY